jgi:DNA-binding CsgD family transcriptional regulator
VKRGPAFDNLVAAIRETCRSGLEPTALRAAVLPRVRRAVPVDALWWATVDPTTLLFTQAYREEIPGETGPYFVENEFLRDDVNKWTALARERGGARTLLQATGGDPARSARYRDIFEPLGLEDELRVVLRTRGVTWGLMCLHREKGTAFSSEEIAFAQRLAPHLSEGIRLGLLVQNLDAVDIADSPGLILLASGHSVVGMNAAAGPWLDELTEQGRDSIPIEVHAIAGRLRSLDASDEVPQLRVRTRAGRWATLHASWMPSQGPDVVAVIIEQASPNDTAPLVMAAYGLTDQERVVSGLVLRGLSTRAISEQLHISDHTVQDHLKAIFDKTGVRSRRDLTATVLRERYLPRAR